MDTYRSAVRVAAWALMVAAIQLVALAPARADNVISVGYAEADPGAAEVQVIVTATNDVAIHGYSIAFTFPTQVLRLTSITVAGTHIGLMQPEFVGSDIDNDLGVGSLGVIFNYDYDPGAPPVPPFEVSELPPTAAGAAPPIIARLSFNVRSTALGGVYPIALRDGIGTPASYNRFTVAGTSIEPRLENGTVVISGGNILSLERKRSFAPSPSVLFYAYAQHSRPLDGFQIAFTYDKLALEQNEATFNGTSLLLELGASRIEFSSFGLDTNYTSTLARSTAAVLFDYLDETQNGQTLSPSTDDPPTQSLVRYRFAVRGVADDTQKFQNLHLDQSNVPGLFDNRFFINAVSLDPTLVDGRIYFDVGTLRGTVVDAVTGQPVRGVRVATDPFNIQVATNTAGVFEFGALLPEQGIPPGSYALKLTKTGYYTAKKFGFVVRGNPAVDDAGQIAIYQVPATPPDPFVRGFVNRDLRLDLSDGVTILNFLFTGGGGVTCQAAADVNDSNSIDISDGVYLLNYLFIGGQRPKPPFSPTREGCSDDPTPPSDGTTLSCDEFEC